MSCWSKFRGGCQGLEMSILRRDCVDERDVRGLHEEKGISWRNDIECKMLRMLCWM
jgi:hypothetical protein